MDLSKLTAKQLEDLAKQARSLAEEKKGQEKKDLRDKLVSMIRDAGFAISDIFPSSVEREAKSVREPATAKYRDPSNPSNTWSGRGRKPRWLSEAEAAGRPLSDFAI